MELVDQWILPLYASLKSVYFHMKEKQHTPKGTAKRNSVSASPARSLPGSSFSSRSPSQASPSPAGRSPVITKPIKDSDGEDSGLMWVDKYKPKSLKQVIGQQGPKSNANKLLFWLKNWHKWVAEGRKPACMYYLKFLIMHL